MNKNISGLTAVTTDIFFNKVYIINPIISEHLQRLQHSDIWSSEASFVVVT